jgi:TolB-like protein/Tfp pilus assembly protein PilF
MECPKCHSENPDDSRFCNDCGISLIQTPETPPNAVTQRLEAQASLEFEPGRHFGERYQIVEELGRGGMGVVYKALDNELNRVVALKMIKPELSGDPEMVRQFKRELILSSEIAHENVVRIHDLGEAQGVKYISMRYIAGTSLRDLLRSAGRLTVDRTVSIAKQVCHALVAAHGKGVIHRDLKPQNVMIDRNGVVYVMDFGLARSLGAMEITTRGMIVGTPDYMSPEQAQGRPANAGSDIYSLGCIMYELVTGGKPLQGDTLEVVLQKHIAERPIPPSKRNSQIPKSLEDVILRCLEKEPARRYRSASDLCEALDTVTGEMSTTATDETSWLEPDEVRQASIAVLPFRDMSPEKDQEYFCDGMAEELTNALVKVDGLRVAALTSAFQFKDKVIDIRDIGKKLGVTAVLEGSVRKAGSQLRVTAQLVNVANGYHMWSERYDRNMEDVFAIQDEISQAIVSALRLKLVDTKGDPVECCGTRNAEAYNLYLKGRYLWNRRTPEGLRKSIEYYQQASDLDPSYALAYTGLADSYLLLGDYGAEESRQKAKTAALRAIEIDPGLAEAHTTLAWIAFSLEHDQEKADAGFRRALELNPDYATAHQWYALYLLGHSRFDEALEQMGIARELDPLSLIIMTATGWLHCLMHRYDDAVAECEKVLDMDPTFGPAHMVLGETYMRMDRQEEGIEEFQEMYRVLGYEEAAESIGETLESSGPRSAILEIIETAEGKSLPGFHSYVFAARLWAVLEEPEKALAALERGYEEGEGEVILMQIMKEFDSIRPDPQFQDLLHRLGLQ